MVTDSAQCDKVVWSISEFAASHASGLDVMDVNSRLAAHFAWNEVILGQPPVLQINPQVCFHRVLPSG